ncbi:MAG: GTP-binding protein, partial [Bacteroidota bacterium]
IDKKEMNIGENSVTLILWDIAGETSATKIPNSYKLGAHGVLYVFDVSRPSTYENINEQITEIRKTVQEVPLICLANKSDLLNDSSRQEIAKAVGDREILFTSAKTGENVESAFESLTKQMMSWD